MEFESFADQAMRGLEEDGYEYISDHPCLAGHWLRRESKGFHIAQVGPLHTVHRQLSINIYDQASAADFEEAGLEIQKAGH